MVPITLDNISNMSFYTLTSEIQKIFAKWMSSKFLYIELASHSPHTLQLVSWHDILQLKCKALQKGKPLTTRWPYNDGRQRSCHAMFSWSDTSLHALAYIHVNATFFDSNAVHIVTIIDARQAVDQHNKLTMLYTVVRQQSGSHNNSANKQTDYFQLAQLVHNKL